MLRYRGCSTGGRPLNPNVAPVPVPEHHEHEDDYLTRTRALVAHAIRRRWALGMITRDADGVFTAFLGANEIEKLMQQPAAATREWPLIEDADYDSTRPLGRLVEQLDLEPSEADLLAVLLACESDPTTARLVAYLGGNQAQHSLTLDLVLEIIYRSRVRRQSDAAVMAHRDLAPNRRLRRLRYVILDGADTRVALAQGIRLDPRIATWLLGNTTIDADLSAISQLHAPVPPLGECDPKHIETVAAVWRAGGRLLHVEGPAQTGREMLLQFGAARVLRPLLVVGGRALTPDRMVAAFREATLRGALLAFSDGDDGLLGGNGENLSRFRQCLEVYSGSVAVIGTHKLAPILTSMRPVTSINVEVPQMGERLRLWQTYLGEDAHLEEHDLRETAALYNLGIGGIVRASQNAREMAAFAGETVSRRHIARAVRQLFDADLAGVANRMIVRQTWDDLVLPEDLEQSIRGIIDRIRYRGDVFGNWGFARKLGKGLGLTALFSGEPGTGKSMVAGLIASQLGLDLYVVDLSQVMSKWLGETEKNLGRAFDAAEAGHVLLLFDEADSVLAKRSGDIKSSNDRHANLETNFILARIEQFNGIAFFTTNLSSALDPAISRRMSVQLQFPYPDMQQRTELWRRMIPAEAPRKDDIDFDELADKYELSGGFIRNIVLRAAFIAAREGCAIGMRHLDLAAEQEYRERGSLVVGGRLS